MQQTVYMESALAELKLKDKTFTNFGRMQMTIQIHFICFPSF